jgi:Cysteine-rich secretory protein family
MKLARPGAAVFAAALEFGCVLVAPGSKPPRLDPGSLKLRLPDLSTPLLEVFPRASGLPQDALKAAVFAEINRDRAAAGLLPVGWDGAASLVADAFCEQQVREATRGHFLMDGVPPYARTGFSGVFGAQSENSVSWVTTGRAFADPAERLALEGHHGMMAEKPPADGHRRTILDPEATHVGVGYAVSDGRFQMAEEFLSRSLERLTLSRREGSLLVVRFDGKPLADWRLEFVTIAREPAPAPLTREQANGRTSYSYPAPSIAYVPEGGVGIRVSQTETQVKIRLKPNREFSFFFAPDRPGLYTFIFYTSMRASEPARPGGSATIWVE